MNRGMGRRQTMLKTGHKKINVMRVIMNLVQIMPGIDAPRGDGCVRPLGRVS